MGFVRDPASFVCVKPGGRTWLIGVATVAEAVKGVDDSVPVTVAVSESVPPAAAVTCPVIVTDQACPAAEAEPDERVGQAQAQCSRAACVRDGDRVGERLAAADRVG